MCRVTDRDHMEVYVFLSPSHGNVRWQADQTSQGETAISWKLRGTRYEDTYFSDYHGLGYFRNDRVNAKIPGQGRPRQAAIP